MELNNMDIKSYRKDEKKENLNIVKGNEISKNNVNSSKEKDKRVEINRISNQNANENNKNIKKDEVNLNKINIAQGNYANKYNLNYDYNKLLNNKLNDRKDQLSNRNEKEKILDIVNKEILKSANSKNDNYANNIIESLNKLQNNEYNYNERYNLGNGLNLNLKNLNKNINEIQEIKIPNLNIELEKALDKKNIQNKGEAMSSSIVNLNLNLNINNNIINNITTPNKVNNDQTNKDDKSKIEINNIINSKRAVSAKPDIRNAKKDYIIDNLIRSKFNFLN